MVKSDRNNLNLKDFNKIIVPIPPIDIQNKIVSTLDTLFSICFDSSISIAKEIEYRQRQYEYYRNKLLTFKELKV